jgi:GNAT superfamily N-acetyltransferase
VSDLTTTLPAGLVVRPLAGPADFPGLTAVVQATRDSAGRLWPATEAWLASSLERYGTSDAERDLIVVELEGRIVGYARVWWRDQTDGTRVVMSQCFLEPAARGRGIGAAMLAWAEGRMESMHAALGDRPADRRITYTWSDDRGGALLLGRNGWQQGLHGYDMSRRLDEVPEALPLPEGFEIRQLGRDDAPAVWDALVEAFADHRDEGIRTDADRRQFAEDPELDPSLWVVVLHGSEIAAGATNLLADSPAAPDGRIGRINSVFTRRAWRRRGLARVVTAGSLALLRNRGATIAELSVDGANPNGAMALYESLGFRAHAEDTEWVKPFPARHTEDSR